MRDERTIFHPARVLADVAAKRQIAQVCDAILRSGGMADGEDEAAMLAERVLMELASTYADHPNYDEDWAL